jgi:ComF family protein
VPFRDLLDELLDLVFPRRCVQCRAVGGWLCPACAAELRPLPARRCRRCGAPADCNGLPGLLGQSRPGVDCGTTPAWSCPECEGRALAFEGAAAAFAYDGPARALVTACKFRAYRSLTREMARLAAPAFAGAVGDDAPEVVVTWVPAHRARTLERGFNQAELLARELAAALGLRAAPLLLRARATARQSGLHGEARVANVAGAFTLRAEAKGVLDMLKRVVIVDDVYTTGETLNHCARALSEAEVETRVFTFARTVRRHGPRFSPRPARTPSSAHREAPFHAKEQSR